MPMNTRRKSLSLAELGITVPKRSRAASHPSPPNTIIEGEEPPVKKSKRSHGSDSPSGQMSPPRSTTIRFKDEKPSRVTELSPPPSPAAEGSNKVDVEGISDDIVVGTIQQLERTGNRPHLVKELGAVLATHNAAVEKCVATPSRHCRTLADRLRRSANPAALISSRLTAYLNRPWPAISPCPLAKDLSPIHPRRLYFYLTTTPHQPIPETVEPMPKQRIITPSLSSASAADEEENDTANRQRTALSPSPEVDLSSPELEDTDPQHPPTPGGSFSARSSVPREASSSTNLSHNRRAASPQLEREERDFKQTANALYEQAQLRRNSSMADVKMAESNNEADATLGAEQDAESVAMSIEESQESVALKDSHDVVALFGSSEHLSLPRMQSLMDFSSPVMQPQHGLQIITGGSPVKSLSFDEPVDAMALDLSATKEAHFGATDLTWDSLQSPENIELAELDDMFDAY